MSNVLIIILMLAIELARSFSSAAVLCWLGCKLHGVKFDAKTVFCFWAVIKILKWI